MNKNQRFVVQYAVGDNCFYRCNVTIPVVYKSKEAFIADFESKMTEKEESVFTLGGQLFEKGDFLNRDSRSKVISHWLPEIFTLDEWFAKIE